MGGLQYGRMGSVLLVRRSKGAGPANGTFEVTKSGPARCWSTAARPDRLPEEAGGRLWSSLHTPAASAAARLNRDPAASPARRGCERPSTGRTETVPSQHRQLGSRRTASGSLSRAGDTKSATATRSSNDSASFAIKTGTGSQKRDASPRWLPGVVNTIRLATRRTQKSTAARLLRGPLQIPSECALRRRVLGHVLWLILSGDRAYASRDDEPKVRGGPQSRGRWPGA